MSNLKKFALPFIATAALLTQPAQAASHHAQATPKPTDPVVTEVMTKALPDIPGKEALMLVVDYPPGGADPVHRHDASAFVYVLEGTIVMQVKGGKEVTLKPGQTFYEGPDDIHTVGRNASQTEPAKFVVVLIKKQGAPALTPVK
ncbi:cupin domain-containing protein [Achromobacter sp.]|uniref:cupin domain-containing protein n=1 Tax=Achromobacter sp. TaxID=134375 RepID=UPI0028A88478|nr:cupin domain-containing protein [Achromobacter sp.]